MKKLGVVISLSSLFLLLAFTCSFGQMEMEKGHKPVVKVMGDEMAMHGGCGGMMHQKVCCQMGSEMEGCHKMFPGMGMHCGMMGADQGMGCCKMGFFLCCKKELELSNKQMKDLKSIKLDFQMSKIRKEADLKIAELELKSLMHEDEASIKDIEAKLKAVAKLKTDMKLSHIKAFRKAKALLTPEQLEKMKKSGEE